MPDPLSTISTRVTSQRQPIPGRTDQVENSAGGYVFETDEMQRALRFLILGTEGGTYYIGEKELTAQNAGLILKLANDGNKGMKLVDLICDVSMSGRAPKQNPTLFALAACAASDQDHVRSYALSQLTSVARTGTMLFQFATYAEQFRGWGRALRRAVGDWYQQDPNKVAYQAVKYRQRGGWTHGDLLRLAHPAGTPEHAQLYRWILGKDSSGTPEIIEGYNKVQQAALSNELSLIPGLIQTYRLPWEALPDEVLNDPAIWEALLPDLGLTALIRQLGRLSKIGLVAPMSAGTKAVISKLSNGDDLVKSRVHPLNILTALYTYRMGHGLKGSLTWSPVPQVIDALDDAFYAAFGNVVPANKKTLVACDVSGSMDMGNVAGSPLTPRDATAALAMLTVRTEPEYACMAFSHQLVGLPLSPKQRLDDVVREMSRLPFGGTDCSLPMIMALQQKVAVETFIILTDSETWAGRIQPTQALEQYRQATGIPARLCVVGMTSNGFSIADPSDQGQLDVVGFDTGTPDLINGFSRSEF